VSAAVRIRRELISFLCDEAKRSPLAECCGLVAGHDDVITQAYPAVNALASATAFEIAPEELFRLMREIRAAGLQMLGIYHSHPNGENKPSARDIERAYYPDGAYLIVSPLREATRPVRAFSICDGRAAELEIQPI
jgi:proteasome lid subunit RPN8/RPN11